MKQLILSPALVLVCALTFGQSKSGASPASASPATSGAIVYNIKQPVQVNPDLASFPVDRPFALEIDSIPAGLIRHIYVYPIHTIKGRRVLYDKMDALQPGKGKYRASFEVKPQDTAMGPNSITMRLPALRAEMEFDISIRKEFSPANLKRALYLNKELDSLNFMQSLSKPDPVKVIAYTRRIDLLFDSLYKIVNDTNRYIEQTGHFLVGRISGNSVTADGRQASITNSDPVYITNIELFGKYFYEPLKKYYQKLVSTPPQNLHKPTDSTVFWTDKFFDPAGIKNLFVSIPPTSQIHNKLYLLKRIADTALLINDVLDGKRRIDFTPLNPQTDPYDFSGRIKNIIAAYKFLDSLNIALVDLQENLKDTIKKNYQPLINLTKCYLFDLIHNKDLLSRYSNVITSQTLLNSTENIWVIGQSDKSPDLSTLSQRIFAINAGVTNIFAHDNSGKLNYIVKPFLGIDLHLKAYDKNADFNQISTVDNETGAYNHILEVKPSFWYKCSFTAGFAFGSMTNKDFTNAYGSFSFTAGPSYLLFKYLKISAGMAAIGRYNNNPLLTSNAQWLYCPYVSLSFDYDLLGVVQGVTTSLFK